MISYRTPARQKNKLKINNTIEGETLEMKIERIVNNKEPIKDGAPLIYTDRKEGIKKAYDIRTDRFEVAIDATDKIAKSYKARREENAKNPRSKGTDEKGNDGKPEPIQGKPEGTDNNPK